MSNTNKWTLSHVRSISVRWGSPNAYFKEAEASAQKARLIVASEMRKIFKAELLENLANFGSHDRYTHFETRTMALIDILIEKYTKIRR